MRKYVFIISLLTALLLAGCSETKEIPTIDVGKIAEETPSKITMNTAAQGGEVNFAADSQEGYSADNSVSSSDVSTYSKTESGISIAADVTVPQRAEFGTYMVSSWQCSEERAREIKEILLGDVDMEFLISEVRDGFIYVWQNDKLGLDVDSRGSDIWLEGDFAINIRNAFFAPRPGSQSNVELFEQRDLDFMTRGQAVQTVTDILDKLNIKVCSDPDIYSLDENGLKAAKIDFEEHYGGELPDFDKSSECYYIKFNARFGDIPIYNELINFQGSEMVAPNPEITAIISADGLQYLYVNEYPSEYELKAPVTEIITAEEAANIAAEKYADASDMMIDINEIKLMYIYDLPDKSEFAEYNGADKMHPAWICRGSAVHYVSKEVQELRDTYSYTTLIDIIIDAVTGKEIL